MKQKYFSSISFWAREFRLPLFWVTDPGHKILNNDFLCLYKNKIMHMYLLNGRDERDSRVGYQLFSSTANVARYKKQVAHVRTMIRRVTGSYKGIEISKLSDDELKTQTFELIGIINEYSGVYTKTEPFMLSRIEADENKYRKLIKELGDLRFALRDEGEPLFYNLIGVFLKESARRFGLNMSDMFFYQSSELEYLFSGKKVRGGVLAARKRGYAVICVKNKKTILTGKKFDELYREIVLQKKKVDQLVGQVAMKGHVRGRVRVVLHDKRNIYKDIMRFRKGEILVTEMTRPDTILACKKAIAIITDEGGITSHAAIISRELKIPCVIATKIATQVLKSGYLVDVDADNGIVKIIKR